MSEKAIKGNFTKTVTIEMVKKIKELNLKYPDIKKRDLAELIGTSESTVSRAIKGDYDFLFNPPKVEAAETPAPDTNTNTDINEVAALLKENNNLLREIIKMWRYE